MVSDVVVERDSRQPRLVWSRRWLVLFLTYYLQTVKGFSPVETGPAFLPMIGCVMASSTTSNRITLPRFGPRVVTTIGMVLAFLGMGYLSRLSVIPPTPPGCWSGWRWAW